MSGRHPSIAMLQVSSPAGEGWGRGGEGLVGRGG